MTDHELLERAARAIGGKYSYGNHADGSMTGYLEVGDEIEYWNPLDNDGDALRLAVALKIEIALNPGTKATRVYVKQQLGDFGITEQHDGNPLAATRRAIVRAAAAIAGDI